jgi:carboxyl-terminal processing protease
VNIFMQQLFRQPLRRLTVLLSGFLAVSTVFPANAKPLQSAKSLQVVATIPFANNPKALVDEAWQVVNREYVDGTFNKNDWQQVRRELLGRKYANNLEAYSAIRYSLKKLGDPYTRFMDPRQFEALTTQTNGEVTGIGVSLGEAITNVKAGKIQILEIVEKSPADKAGIQVGDHLLSINGKSTATLNVSEAAKLIKGEAGQPVTVKLSRTGKGVFDITLKRAQIEVASVSYRVKQENQVKIGYIKLEEFSSHSSQQMQSAIQALNREKVNAFVLDLRGNPGGLLQNSIEIARMFLNQGVIVKTVDRKGRSDESRADQTAITELPLAVLVDGGSASASEILAGAIKDNKRGTIIGSATFGKALVQSVHPLSDKSGLAVTVAHYYTPNGTDIGYKGVSPDIRVAGLGGFDRPDSVTTSQDAAYQSAVGVFQSGRNTALLQSK